MAVLLGFLVLFLAMTGPSTAAYCLCRDGVADSALQRNIDYACGNGADCSSILQNGACYNPNTVKDHCNWAVNSYFQRRSAAGGTCDFQGTAVQSQTPPSGQTSSCVYPASASSAGPATPSGNGTGTGTPGTGTPGTPGTGTPGTSTGTPGSTTTPPVFGISPSGGGGINTDSLATHQSASFFLLTLSLTLLVPALILLRI